MRISIKFIYKNVDQVRNWEIILEVQILLTLQRKKIVLSRIIILENSSIFGIIIDMCDNKGEYKKRQSVHRRFYFYANYKVINTIN